ncbi:hypothetical protein PIB30_078425 [Stylosanthes scabra]|uniref:Uncharacterized protein n=1 Tax=Stylosanthes scabra TaxID=79078 RepID=A0ABU6SR04_9FABA|nr:hypothetical protein [Stylosanthes scabra]
MRAGSSSAPQDPPLHPPAPPEDDDADYDEGDTFKGRSNSHGTWDEFDKVEAMRDLRLEKAVSRKYAVIRMTTDHRLLLYVLSYVFLPRKSNHGTSTEEDLLILWAIIKEKQIH